MPLTVLEESMSTQPTPLSPGLERERRNAAARARIAESRARISRRPGDLLRARQARLYAERAAHPYQAAA